MIITSMDVTQEFGLHLLSVVSVSLQQSALYLLPMDFIGTFVQYTTGYIHLSEGSVLYYLYAQRHCSVK